MKHGPRRRSRRGKHPLSSAPSSGGAGCYYCGGRHVVTSKEHCAMVVIACWGAVVGFTILEVVVWLISY